MERKEKWWETQPWRMVQTNLREIDMEDMDAKAYAEELASYHATVVTLNAAGIIASYDTKLPYHKKSAYLHGDTLKQMLDECHKRGIRVIARCDFSKIHESVFWEHPEWAYRQADGSELNYHGYVQTCINGDYQQKYMLEILRELFTSHDFDGLYCNMSGTFVVDYDLQVHEPCHCDSCRRLFEEQFQMEIPDRLDPKNPAFGRYMAFLGKCAKKQKQKVYETVKAVNGAIAVNGFDYMRTECNQDTNHRPWVYDASANTRRIAGGQRKTIVDDASAVYMAFQNRHSCISPALLELRQWQNLAYGSSTSVYLLSTLGKHRDRSGIVSSQKAFDFFAAHEELYMGQESAARTLLVEKPLMGRNDEEADGWVNALTEMHVPFDEVKQAEVTEALLQRYDTVILADAASVSDEEAAMYDAFASAGKSLVATGLTGWRNQHQRPREQMALESLGLGRCIEKKTKIKSSLLEIGREEQEFFSHCANAQIPYITLEDTFVVGEVLDPTKTKRYLRLIPEQPFGPPEICYSMGKSDIPGVYVTACGSGKGIYLPWRAGAYYYKYGHENTFCLLKDVICRLAGQRSIAENVSPMCEIAVTQKDGDMLVHLMNTSGCFGNRHFEPVPLYNIELDVPLETGTPARHAPTGIEVLALNGGNAVASETDAGITIRLDCLHTYEAILIKATKEGK